MNEQTPVSPENTEAKITAPSDDVPSYEAFFKAFEQEQALDAKLQLAVSFMESAISQEGNPRFKEFWEARKLCMPLFKEKISPIVRANMWKQYSHLSKEARRLKEILDEQSMFAVEQIEIAVKGLEKGLEGSSDQGDQGVDRESFPEPLLRHYTVYNGLQRQLNILNAYAAQVNGLRKELMKTEMRIRYKNKFFQRLSSLGDSIFPKRKELIKELSQRFLTDIKEYVERHFQRDLGNQSFFGLREEIKSLQSLAKVLTINTQAFSDTRGLLSESWDKIRDADKDRKKERAKLRELHKENMEMYLKEIQETSEAYSGGNLSLAEASKRFDDTAVRMRSRDVPLGRDEQKSLREALKVAKEPLETKLKEEEEQRRAKEEERRQERLRVIHQMEEKIDDLLARAIEMDLDEIESVKGEVSSEIEALALSKSDKNELQKRLKRLKAVLVEKQELALLTLSEDDQESLKNFKIVLSQREERRKEIKERYETLRKKKGSLSLDFEQALECESQIAEIKEQLQKADEDVLDIEKRIRQVESKV